MLLEFHDLYYKTFQKIGTLVEVKSNNNKITILVRIVCTLTVCEPLCMDYLMSFIVSI